MSLYEKYRPTSFDKVAGNDQLIEDLRSIISKDDPPHVFLFTGPRGCGKTTIGTILAHELGVAPEDFVDLDSADFRGIDTVRDMRRNSQYKALKGERRAWLIDECHKMTNDAQNALLKGLEKPPSHCFYILCTTDPDKLLTTVRSRCVTYTVKPLIEQHMVALLHKVARAEGEKVERPILQAIFEKSLGHSRDALQLLEQVLATPPEKRMEFVNKAEVVKEAGDKIVKALLGMNGWKAVKEELKTIDDNDVEQVRRAALGYAMKVLLGDKDNDLAAAVLDEFKEPFFNSGKPGLVLACYTVIRGQRI